MIGGFDDEDEEGDYVDGSCLECGAGPDEECTCDDDDEDDEDDDSLF